MPQAIAFHSVRHDSEQWRRVIQARHPDLEWRLWPDETGDPADIVFSLIRRPPMGELARYPNLKGIFSYGAGVEHLLQDPGLPRGVPIVRLIDPTLAQGVVQFIIERVLHMHRDFHRYPTFQRQGSWTTIDYPEARDRHIGILGCGYLDGEAARCLLRLGFSVAGWSRTPKAVEGIESFAGDDALIPFLERTRILVCILPLTPETTGILDARTLAALPEGANLINVGRGAHVVDEDLIAALDSGPPGRRGAGCVPHRAPARRRPLVAPSQDPVDAPPHAAGRAQGDGSPREVAENIARIRAGQPPRLTADPDRGY